MCVYVPFETTRHTNCPHHDIPISIKRQFDTAVCNAQSSVLWKETHSYLCYQDNVPRTYWLLAQKYAILGLRRKAARRQQTARQNCIRSCHPREKKSCRKSWFLSRSAWPLAHSYFPRILSCQRNALPSEYKFKQCRQISYNSLRHEDHGSGRQDGSYHKEIRPHINWKDTETKHW